MLRLATALLRRVRQRPGAALVAFILLGALGTFGGVNLWASHQLSTARQAVQEGRYTEALDHVNRCLRVWWFRGDVQLLAARIERLNGNYPAAEAHLQECQQRIKPATEAMQLEMLLLRAQRGEVDEVGPGLLNAVLEKHHPEGGMILETLARSYLRQNRYAMALYCLNEWLKREPETVRAILWHGFANQHVNGNPEAIKDYERVLELDPGHNEARIRLADMLLVTGNPLDALPHLERLLQSQPNNPDVLVGLARCRQIQGKKAEARQLLDRVLAADPENLGALYYLGDQDMTEGKLEAAEISFRHVLGIDPNFVNGVRKLRDCLARQKDRAEEAAEWSKRLKQLETDVRRLDYLFAQELERSGPENPRVPAEIGELMLRLGNEKLGLHWLEEVALKRDPNDRRSHEILADFYASKKNRQYAGFHRKKAKQKSD